MECFSEDPSFALLVAPEPGDLPVDVDHPEFSEYNSNDDTEMTSMHIAQLQLINPGKTKFTIKNTHFHMAKDNELGFQVLSKFDDETLTDHDANGDIDLDVSSDKNDENPSDSDESSHVTSFPASHHQPSHYQTPEVEVPHGIIGKLIEIDE
ncbi:hypothetical protein BS47DRAFT_1399248 [Hydnum rufescens UP504]|uniref:Uncharacterized protein n=1 Tax=Hydnum rufescens UP504 TaxID=1448309 RepID=A0A9P6AJA2_9AGAM|nr:hypothetical protein BS47DRAFT_1399248 [Hydnum rufescens UP504]